MWATGLGTAPQLPGITTSSHLYFQRPTCLFLSPRAQAQSQIGSKQIYGYLLDVFEIHTSFHHRKLGLTTIFCEALLALANSPLDGSLPPNSANSSEKESTGPVSAHCLDKSGPCQTAKGSFSKRRQDSPFFPLAPYLATRRKVPD